MLLDKYGSKFSEELVANSTAVKLDALKHLSIDVMAFLKERKIEEDDPGSKEQGQTNVASRHSQRRDYCVSYQCQFSRQRNRRFFWIHWMGLKNLRPSLNRSGWHHYLIFASVRISVVALLLYHFLVEHADHTSGGSRNIFLPLLLAYFIGRNKNIGNEVSSGLVGASIPLTVAWTYSMPATSTRMVRQVAEPAKT